MDNLLFLSNLGFGEITIIILAIILLFGAKRIPELMKGVGKGIRGFKEGMKGIEDEINGELKDKDK